MKPTLVAHEPGSTPRGTPRSAANRYGGLGSPQLGIDMKQTTSEPDL